jgi:hypothetical protein
MSLTDIMSGSNLALYPQIALILFLCVFATIAARVFLSRRRRAEYSRAALLPLEERPIATDSNREANAS